MKDARPTRRPNLDIVVVAEPEDYEDPILQGSPFPQCPQRSSSAYKHEGSLSCLHLVMTAPPHASQSVAENLLNISLNASINRC